MSISKVFGETVMEFKLHSLSNLGGKSFQTLLGWTGGGFWWENCLPSWCSCVGSLWERSVAKRVSSEYKPSVLSVVSYTCMSECFRVCAHIVFDKL